MSAFVDVNAVPPQQIWDGLLAAGRCTATG